MFSSFDRFDFVNLPLLASEEFTFLSGKALGKLALGLAKIELVALLYSDNDNTNIQQYF